MNETQEPQPIFTEKEEEWLNNTWQIVRFPLVLLVCSIVGFIISLFSKEICIVSSGVFAITLSISLVCLIFLYRDFKVSTKLDEIDNSGDDEK